MHALADTSWQEEGAGTHSSKAVWTPASIYSIVAGLNTIGCALPGFRPSGDS